MVLLTLTGVHGNFFLLLGVHSAKKVKNHWTSETTQDINFSFVGRYEFDLCAVVLVNNLGANFCSRPKGFSRRTKLDQVINLRNVDVIKVPYWSHDVSKSKEKIFMSIFSLSAPKNFDDRQNLRREIDSFRTEFASNELGSIHLTFLLGLTRDKDVKERIGIESDLFGDILQLSVEDSYHNLSYKTLGAYQWIQTVVSNVTQ
jgi:hypothetical protein